MRKYRVLLALAPLLLLALQGAMSGASPRPRQEAPRSPVIFNPQDAAQLDQPSRDAWQKPAEVVSSLNLRAGDVIADIGTGSGYFVPYLSESVGATGHVYAIDIQPEMLAFVQRKISELDLTNVTTVLSQEADTGLERESVDLAFMVDVYHELGSPGPLLSNIRSVLKPDGRLSIIDFKVAREADRVGPPLSHRVPKKRLIAEVEDAGFTLVETFELLPYQYFLVFTGEREAPTATRIGPQ